MAATGFRIRVLAILAFGLISASCDSGGSAGGDVVEGEVTAPQTNEEHLQMLGALGVPTEIGERKDPSGEDVPPDYNPLLRKQTSIFRQCELYGTGVGFEGQAEFILDDKTEGYGTIYTPEADSAWSANPTEAAAGDVDGGGIEEVIIGVINPTTWDLEIRLIQDAGEGMLVDHRPMLNLGDSETLLPDTASQYWKLDVETGDIDGDARDEVLITAFDNLYIFDDAEADFALIDGEFYPNASDREQYLRVAVGDLDVDGIDEFVVVDGLWDSDGVAEYYIYDSSTKVSLDKGQVAAEVDGVFTTLITAEPVIADFDGDRLLEIAFPGIQGGTLYTIPLIMDDMKQPEPFRFFNTSSVDNNENDDRLPASAAADLNGDRAYELVVEEDILAFENGAWTQPYGNEALPVIHYSILTVGDVTGDLRDDIVLMKDDWKDGICVYGLDSAHNFVELDKIGPLTDGGRGTLVAVNLDEDSAVVEFVEKELLFTDPNIIALLSCPPYHEGIGQEADDIGTTFGKTKGQEVVKEESVGMSVGYTIGAEFNAPFGLASASLKTTVETSLDWTATQSTQVETSVAYTSGPGEDKVVFTTVPFDVFYYRVISSPEPDQVGETLTINIPRKPITLSADREFYNAHNGAQADITPEVIGHVIGDVHSYPTLSERDQALEAGGLHSDVASAGAGSGLVTLGISKTEGEGQGSAFDLSVSVEAEASAGGIVAGVSAGYHYGYSYELTNTEGCFYEGNVVDIPTDVFSAELMYQFGLFVHETSYRGQRFVKVDYWVE